jgi:hypothetical protein
MPAARGLPSENDVRQAGSVLIGVRAGPAALYQVAMHALVVIEDRITVTMAAGVPLKIFWCCRPGRLHTSPWAGSPVVSVWTATEAFLTRG